MEIGSQTTAEQQSGEAKELSGLSASATAVIDPDNPHWGLLAGVGVWLFSYVCPLMLTIFWLIVEQAMGNVRLLNNQELAAFSMSPRGLLISVWIMFVGHILTLVLCWAIVTRFGRQAFFPALGWHWGGLNVSARFYLVAGVVIGVFCLQYLFQFILPEAETTPFQDLVKSSQAVRVSIVFLAVVTAPIVEEIVYRGMLYSGLKQKVGAAVATLLIAVLFCAVHFPQYQGAWASLAGLFTLSFLLTLVRALTGSLLPCFVIHLVNNLIGGSLILLSASE